MNEQARRNWEQPIEIVEVSEEIQRYLAHRERSRFMRFYKACGWMSVVQCVVVAAALVLFLVVGLMAGDYAIVLGTVVLPALVGFSLRGVLIRYLRMTRIMWKTTFFLFIGLFVFKSQIPPDIQQAVVIASLAIASWHLSTTFWVCSDKQIMPSE